MTTQPSSKIPANYEYIYRNQDMQRILNWLEDKKLVCVDLETTGLSCFRDEIVLFQIGDKDKQWVIDTRVVDIEPLRPICENKDVLKVGQNFKFDVKFLMFQRGWDFTNVACTMVMEHVIRCGIYVPADLYSLTEHYLGVQLDKDEKLRKSFGGTPVGQFTERQLTYAAYDVIVPELIIKKQKHLIKQRGLMETVKLENLFLPVLATMELAGMPLDTKAWIALYQESVKSRAKFEKQLDDIFGIVPLVQEDLFSAEGKTVRAIDYASPRQVSKALAKLGYNTTNEFAEGYIKDTGHDSIALAAINGYLPLKIAQALISYRISLTRTTRYGPNFVDAIEKKTGNVHSDFTQAFTTTGRLSSGDDDEDSLSKRINFQNIPRLAAFRKCFVAPKGYKFVIYDFQAIEPRILGELSKDPTYLYTFKNNKDIYSEIGTKIYKQEVSKKPGTPSELRMKTKIGVLGTSYGTGKNKFFLKMLLDMNSTNGLLNDNLVFITREESDKLWDDIFVTCPRIRDCLDTLSSLANPLKSSRRVFDAHAGHEFAKEVFAKLNEVLQQNRLSPEDAADSAQRLTKNRGLVTFSESCDGRKRFFKVYHKTWWTEGRNHPIQSTAADIIKYAMVWIYLEFKEKKMVSKIINQVHDELIILAPDHEAEQANEIVKRQMLAAESRFLKEVPAKVEGGIFTQWEK